MFDWIRPICERSGRIGSSRLKSSRPFLAIRFLFNEQDANGEIRYVYYGETAGNRMIAVVLTERDEKIRVITAYDLDTGQRRDYLKRRAQEQ